MASWEISGAGTVAYDGIYSRSGSYNGKATYTNENGKWLWWDTMVMGRWILSSAVGAYDDMPSENIPYRGSGVDLPANPWYVSPGGTGPAPTVSEHADTPTWPWPYWWEEGGYVAGGIYAPCEAVLGGDTYLVLPADDAVQQRFELFDTSLLTFSYKEAPSAFFPVGSWGYPQTFSAYDDAMVHLYSGRYDPGDGERFIWKTYDLSGASATEHSSVTVSTDGMYLRTPFVEHSENLYRFAGDGTPGGVASIRLGTYEAGGASIDLSAYVALPSLPSGYTEGTVEWHLFPYGDDYYLFRRVDGPGGNDFLLVYIVTGFPGTGDPVTCTALDDMIYSDTGALELVQTWGADPIRDVAFGDFGDGTVTTQTEQWVPETIGYTHDVFAKSPAKRHWYVPSGGRLYVMGWTGEDSQFRHFVLDTSSRDGIFEGVDGNVVTSGAGVVAIMQQVKVPADGTVEATGAAKLLGTTKLTAVDGTVVLYGDANLLATVGDTNPDEGPGSFMEVRLTGGVWPGAERRYAVPSWYERAANRGYGGILSAPGQPSVTDRIAAGNSLSQYAAWWSWFAEDTADRTRLADATTYGRDGVVGAQVYDNYTFTFSGCAETAADQEYTPDRYEEGSEWWLKSWTSEDGAYRVVASWLANPWALLDEDDNVVAWCNAYQFPWSHSWVNQGGGTFAVTQGDLVSRWRSNGLEVANYFVGLPNGMGVLLDSAIPALGMAWTWMADYVPYIAQAGSLLLQTATVGGTQDSIALYHQTDGSEITGLRLSHYHLGVTSVLDWTFSEAVALGDAMRVVLSVDATAGAKAWLNGASLGAAQAATAVLYGGAATNPVTQICGNNQWGNWNWAGYIAREMGYLAGYAATEADVNGNGALARLYGFKGTPFAVSDDAV